MKTSLVLLADRQLRRVEGREQIEATIAAGHRYFWLDIEAPDEEDVAWLGRRFDFHPLALADIRQPNYRPKLAEFETHLFLIAHEVSESQTDIAAHEVHALLTTNCLVTVHDVPSNAVAKVQRTFSGQPAALARGPDFVLYMLLNEIVETYFDVVDVLDDVIDQLEADVVRDLHEQVLNRVFDLRRGLATMRRLSTHLRDALNALLAHEGKYVRRGNILYFRDVQTLLITVHELVDSQRDLTSGVLEVYMSSLSNRLSDVMKRLTIVATIFLPISFVAGVFGTNFAFMPFESPFWFAVFVASLIAVPVAMLIWFRRLDWI